MASNDDVVQIIKNRTSVNIQASAPLTGLSDILQANVNYEIDGALRDYSMDEPLVVMQEVAASGLTDVSGVKFYELASWDFDTSSASDVEIEFPVDLATRSLLFQGPDLDYEIVERLDSGTRKAYIKFMSPPSGSPGTWRLKYSGRYQTLVESATLANLTYRAIQMVGLLAASYVARFLSGKFAKTSDATIDADVVDHGGKATEYATIADNLFQEYQDRIDRPSRVKRVGQDVGIVDLDISLGRSTRYGREFLVHRKRRR